MSTGIKKGDFDMKIGFGNDHAAIALKHTIMQHLKDKGYECVDFGVSIEGEKADYPVQGQKVAEAIKNGEVDKGVLICGTGIGISLAANKVPGIRAAAVSDPYSARMAVEHNNAQIIAFGARVVGDELAKMIVDSFFDAKFLGALEGGERHAKRVAMIGEIEAKYNK